ncbi:geranylgeranyl pyrophosphate synthetase [Phyllosticta citribraziliensis]|uniref:Geranylgeranyl pyrophosphate synthetase n=1 Tax=Phyllosticta citribraziliensis TaxID=989973 RepID=A0ABR1LEA1_9PEZI
MTDQFLQRGNLRGRPYGRTRGRGRGGSGYSNTSRREKPQEQSRPPSPPVGPILNTIELDLDSKPDERSLAKITNCQYISSYNWIEKGESPTIMIPGSPPAWTPLEEPKQLQEDAGVYYRDANAARYPKHPTEPSVRAIFAMNREFASGNVDIFACGSTLGNLLRFVRKSDRPFRFLVQVVGNTVFFVRHENSPTETLQGVRGFGHTFPEAYTTWEGLTKGSQSHQRIVQYDFAGLNCVVRYESDGYLKNLDPEGDDCDDEYPHLTIDTGTSLKVVTGGRKIAQGTVFDLKTRSVKRMDQDVLGEEVQRLWLSQTPNFVLAFHEWGTFKDIRVDDVRKNLDAFEDQHQDKLAQLAAVLRKISALAKAHPDKKLEVRRKELDVLEIRGQASNAVEVLPEDVKEWWIDGAAVSKPHSEASSGKDGSDEEFYSSPASPIGGVIVSDSDGESEQSELDYTACSSDSCGYCGRCRY